MERLRAVLLFLLCWALAYTLVQASRWWHRPPAERPIMPIPYAEKLAEQRRLLAPRSTPPSFNLQEHRARVLIICAGSVENPKTENWLRQLTQLRQEGLPKEAEIIWLAVGARLEEAERASRLWRVPFQPHVDPMTSVVESLGYGLDPTLYVVGKWGAVRYAGDLRPRSLARMVVMLSKEQENGDHQFFSNRGADTGHSAPEFALPDRDGRTVTLKSLQGRGRVVCLLFAGKDVHAGPSVMGWLAASAESAGNGRVQAGIVYSLVDAETVPNAGSSRGPDGRSPNDVHVLIDESGEVAAAYRLDQPPLLLIIGPRGTIHYRGNSPRDAEAVMAAVLHVAQPAIPTGAPLLPP